MKIAIDLDGTINANRDSVEFFSIMTHLLIPEHRIYILTNREPNTEQLIADELAEYGIDYNQIVITSDKALFMRNNNISIYFENEDEYLLELNEEVTVFKIREDGNFDFAEKKWIGSRATTILIDE